MKATGPRFSRRRFLGGVSLAGAASFGYARFFEAERLEVRQCELRLAPTARKPLRLAHLSDLHSSPVVSLDYISIAIQRAIDLKPDLICLTGDYITSGLEHPADYTAVLRKLSNVAPCYAVLGNHDGGAWAQENDGYHSTEKVCELLKQSGIRLLHNESVGFDVNGWSLHLVGLADAWSGQFNPSAAFAGAAAKMNPRADATICLSHNPDTKTPLSAFPWDLMLSGHTHGGQLRMPVIGTPFAPVHDKRFVEGLHRWNNRWLHVSAGVGSVYGLRVNCPPEINLLTLT